MSRTSVDCGGMSIAESAGHAPQGWVVERMDFLPIDTLGDGFTRYTPLPPVLTPIPLRTWMFRGSGFAAPYPILLSSQNGRATTPGMYGLTAPDDTDRIWVTTEEQLLRHRFPHVGPAPMLSRPVSIDEVWMLGMDTSQSVYWREDTPEWPALVRPDQMTFDHPAPMLPAPQDRPQPRVLTRPQDQMGALTGRRGWRPVTRPNAWQACVVLSEIFCDIPSEAELEAWQLTSPTVDTGFYLTTATPAEVWLHQVSGEPLDARRTPEHMLWL